MTRPTCRTCPYWQAPDIKGVANDLANAPAGECHYGPAQVAIVPVQVTIPGPRGLETGMQLQNLSAWPPKKAAEWCGRHPEFQRQMEIERPQREARQPPPEGAA